MNYSKIDKFGVRRLLLKIAVSGCCNIFAQIDVSQRLLRYDLVGVWEQDVKIELDCLKHDLDFHKAHRLISFGVDPVLSDIVVCKRNCVVVFARIYRAAQTMLVHSCRAAPSKALAPSALTMVTMT